MSSDPDTTYDRPWMNSALSPDERTALLLAQMTLEEKVHMLCEHSICTSLAQLGVPVLAPADGPAGIRVANQAVHDGQATSMPAPLALAATWDVQAAEEYGKLVGAEAWASGHNVFFGPGMDIARVPVFGRMFESFSEDPVLTGELAVRYIRGVQSHPVLATAKHYTINAQEERRMEVDVRIGERTLQEIYILPFAMAVQDAQVAVVMGAYHKVNGIYCCEHPHLLTTILKEQLGFAGWVTSDFMAVHSTVEAINAGLDWELGEAIFFGDTLLQAIQAGQMSLATVDEKVRRILRSMFAFELFEQPPQIAPLPVQEHGRLARKIAGQGIVLLKNTDALLPLAAQELRSIAVIGADADSYIAGGGSSYVKPTYLVSMLEGIRQRVGEGVRVDYAAGVDAPSAADLLPGLPGVPSSVLRPVGADEQMYGLRAEYWTNPHFEGEPALVRVDRQISLNLGFFNFISALPVLPLNFGSTISVRWTGSITPPVSGDYTLALSHLGTARLFLNDQVLIDDPGLTLETHAVTTFLHAGQAYALRIEYAADRPEQDVPGSEAFDVSLTGAQIRFGWQHPAEALPPAIQAAAALAAQADVALIVARDFRYEHADLPNLALPNEQNLLIQTVAAANPRTIIVLATGGPIALPWLDQVPAVLAAWYGGQEQGNALADVLFGSVNPSGKLPVTFPCNERETPVATPEQYSRDTSTASFSEGLNVGYRGYDQLGIEPLFPFGYGLSYTSFAYDQLRVSPEISDGVSPITISFTITNTGLRTGAEIAQVYLGLPASALEPPQRLVTWTKIELQPGETRQVSLTLDPDAASRPLSYWDVRDNAWKTASGDYLLFVGASSRKICLTGTFSVQDTETQRLE